MFQNVVLLEGSARSNGDTRVITNYILLQRPSWELVDLNLLDIRHFHYGIEDQGDDFLPTMRKLLHFDTLVMITPVYWYTMSGRLKVFIDRFSDLLDDPYKDLGRELRGKSLASVSCSRQTQLIQGFEIPIEETAAYMGMKYRGHFHTWVGQNGVPAEATKVLDQLIGKIEWQSK